MSRQLVAMRMGVGVVSWRESRFCLRVMGRVGLRVFHGMMSFVFIFPFLVLAG